MDLLSAMYINDVYDSFLVIVIFLLMLRGMYKLVVWSKKMPKGAFILLAIFPLVSVFPIPPQEIKKLERIKQEQVQSEDESGEPPNEDNDGA